MISLRLKLYLELERRKMPAGTKDRITSFLIFIFIIYIVCIQPRNKYYLKSKPSWLPHPCSLTGLPSPDHIWGMVYGLRASRVLLCLELKFDQFLCASLKVIVITLRYLYISILNERVCNVLASLIMNFGKKKNQKKKKTKERIIMRSTQTNC